MVYLSVTYWPKNIHVSTNTIKWYQYPAFIDLRDTIITIQWDQYSTFIDLTRHYIYNKMRSVLSLYRLTRHYIYNKMRSVKVLLSQLPVSTSWMKIQVEEEPHTKVYLHIFWSALNIELVFCGIY